jgi:hypothetical protein
MSKTSLDGAKDVFFTHENIVRKLYPSHQNYTYVGLPKVLLGLIKIIFTRVLFILARSSMSYAIKKKNSQFKFCFLRGQHSGSGETMQGQQERRR